MIVPPRVAPPLALLLAVLVLTATFSAGIARAPSEFFGVESDVMLVLPPGGSVTSTGSVSEKIVELLLARDNVSAASGEIVVLTVLGGGSALVRGADVEALVAFDALALAAGRLPESADEAVIGARLADRLDTRLGERVLVPGSLYGAAATVRIVGVVDGRGPGAEELLVGLPLARGLAGLPEGMVHFVRARVGDPAGIRTLLTEEARALEVSDVEISSREYLLGEPIRIRGNVTNWGDRPATKLINVTSGGTVLAQEEVLVAPRSTASFDVALAAPGAGEFAIEVNPTFHVSVRPAAVSILGVPEAFVVGEPAALQVVDAEGAPVAGVDVRLDATRATTDGEGRVELIPAQPGPAELVAHKGGAVAAIARSFVVLPEHEGRVAPAVLALAPRVPLVAKDEGPVVLVTLRNDGGATGEVAVEVLVDGRATGIASAELAPGESRAVAVEIPPLAPGVHHLSVEGSPLRATVESVEGEPEVERAFRLLERARLPRAVEGGASDGEAYLARLVGDVTAAVTALTLAAGLLVTLAAISLWLRVLGEREQDVLTLRALGASKRAAQALVRKDALRWGLPAAGAGAMLGWLVGLALGASGSVRAFGHVLVPRPDLPLLLGLSSAFVLANVLIAHVIAGAIYERRALLAPPHAAAAGRPLTAAVHEEG